MNPGERDGKFSKSNKRGHDYSVFEITSNVRGYQRFFIYLATKIAC